MITIGSATETVKTVLPVQEIDANKVYRPISFCVTEDIDGTVVAYNSLTGELVELTEFEKEVLQKESVEYCSDIDELIKKYFLVPTDHDDIGLCEEIREFLKIFKKEDRIKTFTVFTTMDCNARCFYCYEMGRPRTPMSEEVAKKTANFIIEKSKGQPVLIAWFGGEPLYNVKVIDIITDMLRDAGVQFKSSFTSNGYLFEQDIVDKAVEKWNIERAQITLDGTEEVYNRAKAYINSKDKNPFVIVTDNIERLLKKDVHITVRMNMGPHNKDDLFELVDWCAERYKGYRKFSMYPHLLFETDASNPLDRDTQMSFARDLLALEKHCTDKKFFSVKGIPKSIKISNCMADTNSAITVTPLGNLGKCEHFSDNEFVGTLDTGITDFNKVAEFSKIGNAPELCKGCSAYPLCIQLEKCPDVGLTICNDAKRFINETHVKQKMINSYRKIKKANS